jgi:hypothetical protein
MTAGCHHVRRSLSVCAIALLAVSLAPAGVEAEPQSKAKATKPAPNSALAECYKQAGASYNPDTKRWTMYSGHENEGIFRQDALRQCVARARGVSPGSVAIRETLSERYGGEPPRR